MQPMRVVIAQPGPSLDLFFKHERSNGIYYNLECEIIAVDYDRKHVCWPMLMSARIFVVRDLYRFGKRLDALHLDISFLAIVVDDLKVIAHVGNAHVRYCQHVGKSSKVLFRVLLGASPAE